MDNNIEKIEDKKPERFRKYVTFAWEIVKIAIVAFVIVAPIRYFLFQPFIVSGDSMVPNLQSGNYLIVDEISYRFSAPERGDVVVFNAGFIPGYANQRFIKRIIGLPGETVDVKNGKVDITKGGKTIILDEKYLPNNLATLTDKKITLGANEYFVLGDNRQYSYDSRYWGAVSKKEIIGKAALRLFPITELSIISKPAY